MCPVDANRNEWYLAAAGDRDEPRLERCDFAVARAGSFGEDKNELPGLEAPQRLLEPRQTAAFVVDRNRVEEVNQLLEHRHAKERVAGQVIHPPQASESNQRRIEVALMIRAD